MTRALSWFPTTPTAALRSLSRKGGVRVTAASRPPGPLTEPSSRPLAGTIDVWTASLETVSPTSSALAALLDASEQARAARFVFESDRRRFVAGRAFLRLLLARCLGATPFDVRFRDDGHGKPALAGIGEGLQFNLAHSGSLAACALTGGDGPIGVDLELVEPIGEVRALARAVLSPRELSRLDALPEPLRLRAFYDAWTRKEAFLKALGCGLNRPPDGVEVAFGPGEPPLVLSSSVDPSEPDRFAIHAFEPRAGYVGAVAFAGRARRVRELTWHWA